MQFGVLRWEIWCCFCLRVIRLCGLGLRLTVGGAVADARWLFADVRGSIIPTFPTSTGAPQGAATNARMGRRTYNVYSRACGRSKRAYRTHGCEICVFSYRLLSRTQRVIPMASETASTGITCCKSRIGRRLCPRSGRSVIYDGPPNECVRWRSRRGSPQGKASLLISYALAKVQDFMISVLWIEVLVNVLVNVLSKRDSKLKPLLSGPYYLLGQVCPGTPPLHLSVAIFK